MYQTSDSRNCSKLILIDSSRYIGKVGRFPRLRSLEISPNHLNPKPSFYEDFSRLTQTSPGLEVVDLEGIGFLTDILAALSELEKFQQLSFLNWYKIQSNTENALFYRGPTLGTVRNRWWRQLTVRNCIHDRPSGTQVWRLSVHYTSRSTICAKYSNLGSIQLHYCSVDKATIQVFTKIASLKSLYISSTQKLSVAEVDEIWQAWPNSISPSIFAENPQRRSIL